MGIIRLQMTVTNDGNTKDGSISNKPKGAAAFYTRRLILLIKEMTSRQSLRR